MKCSQMGKNHTIRIKDLTKETGEPVTEEDLKPGNSLIMDYRGKPYPAEFVRNSGT